jgi:hypothetical protein
MEQLLCHLVADYWLQNDWMATNKKKYWFPAIVHGVIYTLPFLLLTRSWLALFVICSTHIVIDHSDIVNKLNQLKNWNFKQFNMGYFKPIGSGILQKSTIELKDGYGDRPLFIRIWLLIIQDNILHLVINYLALRWL